MKWLDTAKALIGTKEFSGKANNSKIISWAQKIGGWISSFYKEDSIPWCGLFVAYCFATTKIPVRQDALGAKNWLKWGEPTTPRLGAVMVFARTGGGHVGFYVSEDNEAYHILGGNQSDMVNIARVAKNRFVGARWPTGVPIPAEAKVIKKKFDGKLSVDEA